MACLDTHRTLKQYPSHLYSVPQPSLQRKVPCQLFQQALAVMPEGTLMARLAQSLLQQVPSHNTGTSSRLSSGQAPVPTGSTRLLWL